MGFYMNNMYMNYHGNIPNVLNKVKLKFLQINLFLKI